MATSPHSGNNCSGTVRTSSILNIYHFMRIRRPCDGLGDTRAVCAPWSTPEQWTPHDQHQSVLSTRRPSSPLWAHGTGLLLTVVHIRG